MNHETEHILVEPFIGHYQITVLAVFFAPAILNFPFQRCAVGVKIDSCKGHGMAGTAIECFDALCLVHVECGAENATIIEVLDV